MKKALALLALAVVVSFGFASTVTTTVADVHDWATPGYMPPVAEGLPDGPGHIQVASDVHDWPTPGYVSDLDDPMS